VPEVLDVTRDTIRVDHEALRAAKLKYRTLVKQAERGTGDVHTAYKLGIFLTEALGVAWDEADTHVPDSPPDG
jgi:hypothetical protein